MTHFETLSLKQQQFLKFLAALIRKALNKIFEYELKNYEGWQIWLVFNESNARFIEIKYDEPGIHFSMAQLQQLCKLAEALNMKFSISEQYGVFLASFFTGKYIEICNNWNSKKYTHKTNLLQVTLNEFLVTIK